MVPPNMRSMACKVRYAPKAPPRRTHKPIETKTEVVEDAEAAQSRELLRRVNEASARRGPKVEKKPVQVAFGYGGASPAIRTFGVPRGGTGSSSTSRVEPQVHIPDDNTNESDQKKKKEYVEPWNYYTYYPVTLPLRRPYSGNPELLDEEEFGKDSSDLPYEESTIKPAVELGLMEEGEEQKMFFIQLPDSLPLVKRSASAKGKDMARSSKPLKSVGAADQGCSLEELPPGFMGKMLVYKSGAVKLKLGETLYDVSSGSDCIFAQDVVAINTEDRHCCVIGELYKRAIITPDFDSLLL
uniref:DNA-directed RNA polymerase III subunit RPC4 n=1 Tax=Nelumbo nucifera TaxID=4432 RepID=A0A822ZWX0_NELNU|nr:TPA_asm: hypothetical protein HUJ06_017666 [Nelumbo nucifera]